MHIYAFTSFPTFRLIYSVLNKNFFLMWRVFIKKYIYIHHLHTRAYKHTHLFWHEEKPIIWEIFKYFTKLPNWFCFQPVCLCLVVDSAFARRAQELCSGGKHQQEKMSRCVKSVSLPLSSWSADESLQREIRPSRNSRDWAECELHRDTAGRDKEQMSVTLKERALQTCG